MKARYSKHYRISAEELAWLGERVEVLGQAVQVAPRWRVPLSHDCAGRWTG